MGLSSPTSTTIRSPTSSSAVTAAQPSLYENAGNGHFQETNQGTFAQADRHGCDAADVNGDGLKDIFCTEGANHGTSAKRNELYIQRPDHTFAEQAGQYGVLDPFGRGRSAKFIEANGDSRPDLFVANNPTRGDGMPSPNRFFTNQLGDAFRYAPAYGLERETSLQGSNASVGDLDKDGWQDLLVITPPGPSRLPQRAGDRLHRGGRVGRPRPEPPRCDPGRR